MNPSLDISENTRSLGNLQKHDVIEFESEHLDKNIYMIISLEMDDEIPALLLQLWKFDGHYNHASANVMENDLGINQQVPYFEPKIYQGKIKSISSYRPKESDFTKKEEYFFNVKPDSTSSEPNENYSTPYTAIIDVENAEEQQELILPAWTPLQKLPLDRVGKGTVVEIWEVESITNVMKVIQL